MKDSEKDLLMQSKDLIERMTNAIQKNEKTIMEQKNAIDNMAPFAEFAYAVRSSDKHYSWAVASKLLHEKVYEGKQTTGQRGRNTLIRFLRECDVVKPAPSKEPYQKFVNQGLFVVKQTENPNIGIILVTRVTGKGLQWLLEKLIEWEYVEWLGLKDKKTKK